MHVGKTKVTSEVSYLKNQKHPSNILVLNGQDQTIVSVHKDGQPFDAYVLSDDQMMIETAGERFTLTIVSEIDPASNTALEGLYQSQGTYCTQCEAEGFRRITYYQDRHDRIGFHHPLEHKCVNQLGALSS